MLFDFIDQDNFERTVSQHFGSPPDIAEIAPCKDRGVMNITVTPMTAAHLPVALRLWAATEGVGLSEGDDEPQLCRFLGRNPGLSHVSLDGEQVVGAVLCGHDGRRGFLYHLAVLPEYRRRGIGQRLVDASLAALAREGIPKCSIFLFADNDEGKSFWKELGWSNRPDLEILQHRPVSESP